MKVVIVRSRRKTLSLSVSRMGEVTVRAPLFAKDSEIMRFAEKHRDWIDTRLARLEKSKLNLADGAKLKLFGEEYTVATGRTAIVRGEIRLPQAEREAALIRLLKSFSKQKMNRTTERFSSEYGFCYAGVRVSSARGRWGSCNKKGSISYSFRIALLPQEIADYIAVHELCHTRYFNHSADFWREVEKIMPDYKARRKILKSRSDLMNLL